MPRTRNVTRSQWDAATSSTNNTRNRNQNENNIEESEKENAGRQSSRATRSQARTGGRTGLLGASNIAVLGATTAATNKTKGEKAAKLKTASKGKGVPPSAPIKRKKQPLQDITAEFLPAQAESANRGEDVFAEGVDEDARTSANANVVVAAMPQPEVTSASVIPAPKFTSPLPPSSPPSNLTVSPSLHPISSAPKLVDNFHFSSSHSIPQAPYDPWQEFDDARLAYEESTGKVSSNSDPFGFVSLERKLKVEREAAAIFASDQDHEDAALILVADTSSPRPVRRLKRSLQDENELLEAVEEVHDHPHYTTPPTPHKDKQKRRRMSHEGHDVFSPCSSSVETSPSPSKASTRKRPQPILSNDPLDKFNEALDRSYEQGMTSEAGIQEKEASTVDPDTVSRNLRSREKRRLHLEFEEDQSEKHGSNKVVVKGKGKSAKKPVSKSRSATIKKNATKKEEESDAEHHSEHEDLNEKWERERQERVEYFKRLESYEVEKEDVFLI
ncbi:hypothetical protein CVT25_003462 [Psilocybe cyanescens]|uniref:Uncharacterized protein n=1 Tax=Psilocybe cyanescens TaxID=93625 RepID=A0A409X523_PSICY|nr:hypothetical protein CVT25_003462 [Psilocybe cyanescens]